MCFSLVVFLSTGALNPAIKAARGGNRGDKGGRQTPRSTLEDSLFNGRQRSRDWVAVEWIPGLLFWVPSGSLPDHIASHLDTPLAIPRVKGWSFREPRLRMSESKIDIKLSTDRLSLPLLFCRPSVPHNGQRPKGQSSDRLSDIGTLSASPATHAALRLVRCRHRRRRSKGSGRDAQGL